EVELDDRRRATSAGHAQTDAAGDRPGAQLDADAVHPASGLEGPAIEHPARVPAHAGEQVGSDGDLPLGAELRLLHVAAAPLLHMQSREGDGTVGKEVI